MRQDGTPSSAATLEADRAVRSARPAWAAPVLAAVVFAAVVAGLAWRAADDLSPDRQNAGSYADFRDAVYYPVKALADGNNPYDVDRYFASYPVAQEFPVYGPHHLALWLPLAALPIGAARIVYGGVMLAAIVVIAGLSVVAAGRRPTVPLVLGIATVVLVSTPGRFNFLTGQSTALAVLGCYLAFWFARTRPAIAGVGLALAMLKPVFALPVVALLLFQGRLRTLWWGAGITTLVSLPVIARLVSAAGGIGPLVRVLRGDVSTTSSAPSMDPVTSETRIDLHSLVAKAFNVLDTPLASVVLLVVVIAVATWVIRQDEVRGRPVVQMAAALAVLLSIVHQEYDMLLLVGPLVGLAFATTRSSNGRHLVILALCLVAAFNPLATDTITSTLHLANRPLGIATSAALLTAAFVVASTDIVRARRVEGGTVPERIPVAAA